MPTRRDFIAGAASSGLLAAIPLDRSLPLHAGERPGSPSFALDDTDLSWVSRLRGKSRAVFDSPEHAEGGALFRASGWRKQMKKVFGTPIEDLTPVVVFRHGAIAMVMDDVFWDHLGIGKDLEIKDPKTGKWTKRNPISTESPDAPGTNIPAFIQSGGIVLACGLAFGSIIWQYKEKDKVADDEAEKRARAHLIPGVIIQPSGFFAVLKAQEEGCHYVLGS